ncbi:hypothetical protein [Legionella yabuuchiae]|uniref:hypothetical protein n=1 Tax=Legionella yabuuchiae TaxID=376727 RepID=UPI001056720A|nr:hypothetical protein [Legionella yabuuchiae]
MNLHQSFFNNPQSLSPFAKALFDEVIGKKIQSYILQYVKRTAQSEAQTVEISTHILQEVHHFHNNQLTLRVVPKSDTNLIEMASIKFILHYLTELLTANNMLSQFTSWFQNKVQEASLTPFPDLDAMITSLLGQLNLDERYRVRLRSCFTVSQSNESPPQFRGNLIALTEFASAVLEEEQVIVDSRQLTDPRAMYDKQRQALALIKQPTLSKEDVLFLTKLQEESEDLLTYFFNPLTDESGQTIILMDALCESYFGLNLVYLGLYNSQTLRTNIVERFQECKSQTQHTLFDAILLDQHLLEKNMQTEEQEAALIGLILQQSQRFVDGTSQDSFFKLLLLARNQASHKLISTLARGGYTIDPLLRALIQDEQVLFSERSLFKAMCRKEDGCVLLNKLIAKHGHEQILSWLASKPEQLLAPIVSSAPFTAFDMLSKLIDGKVFLATILLSLCEQPQFFAAFTDPIWLFEIPRRMGYLLKYNLPVLTLILSKYGTLEWLDAKKLAAVFQEFPILYEQVELRTWFAEDLQGQRFYAHLASHEAGALFKKNLPLPDKGPILPTGFMIATTTEAPDDLSKAVEAYWHKIYSGSATYAVHGEVFQSQLEQLFSVLKTVVEGVDPTPKYVEQLESFHNRLKLNRDNQTEFYFKRVKYLLETLTYLWHKQKPAIIKGFLKAFFEEIAYCHAGVNEALEHAVSAMTDGWRGSISNALTQATFEFAMYHDDLLGVHQSFDKHTGGLMLQHLADLGIGVSAPGARDVTNTTGCRLSPLSYQWLQNHIYLYYTRARCIQIVYDATVERVKQYVLQQFSIESAEVNPYTPGACCDWMPLQERLLGMPFLNEIHQKFGMASSLAKLFDTSDEETYKIKLLSNFDEEFPKVFAALVKDFLQLSNMITPPVLQITLFSLADSEDFSPSEKRALAGFSDDRNVRSGISGYIQQILPNGFSLKSVIHYPKLTSLLQYNPNLYKALNLNENSAGAFIGSLFEFIQQRQDYISTPFQTVPIDFESRGLFVNEVLIGICKVITKRH